MYRPKTALVSGLLVLAAVLGTGCQNACQELADIVCERSGQDLDACKAAPQPTPAPVEAAAKDKKASLDPCDKIRVVTASCEALRVEATKATAEDKDACHADLELVRALDKQQM